MAEWDKVFSIKTKGRRLKPGYRWFHFTGKVRPLLTYKCNLLKKKKQVL